jgi:hypothetical protein
LILSAGAFGLAANVLRFIEVGCLQYHASFPPTSGHIDDPTRTHRPKQERRMHQIRFNLRLGLADTAGEEDATGTFEERREAGERARYHHS